MIYMQWYKQSQAGWGAKIIDRLAKDLRETFPDMKGFSSRNLKYMRAFAAAWPEREIVQEPLAQITWYLILAYWKFYFLIFRHFLYLLFLNPGSHLTRNDRLLHEIIEEI